MKSLESKLIIKMLSKKYNIPESEVNLIVNSWTLFIKNTIRDEVNRESMYYPSFRVPNLGKFYVPNNVKKHVFENLKNMEDNKDEPV